MQAMSPRVPQVLYTRNTIVVHLDPLWGLRNQPRSWPHLCMHVLTKPSGPVPATGAPIICSDILQALSRWQWLKSADQIASETLLRFQLCFPSHVTPVDGLAFQLCLPMWVTLGFLNTPRARRVGAAPCMRPWRMRLLPSCASEL